MNEDDCLLYLLRHGATLSNLEKPARLQGQGVNLDLSEVGRAQSARAAELLAPFAIDAVYASPLLRSQQTAAAIAAPHRLTVQIVAEIIEADGGRWEGRNWSEIAAEDAAALALYREDAAQHGYPEGENMTQIHARVFPAMTALAARHTGQHVVVVGHGMAIRALLAPLLGLSLSHAGRLPQDNGGVNVLRFHDGQWKVITLNSTLHLAPPSIEP